MTLPELCEPLFQYMCRLNRMARKGTSPEHTGVRNEIRALFQSLADAAKGDFRLSEQFRRVEMPLIFFVDSMIAESTLRFAPEWNKNRLAYERNELAGDEKFFDLLDEALKETKEGADERLAIFYTCLGLGFTGWYGSQPEYLRKRMNEIAPRVRTFVDADEAGLICPDAYQHTNLTNLPMPISSSLVPIIIAAVGLVVVVAAANLFLFRVGSQDLEEKLDRILARDPAAVTR